MRPLLGLNDESLDGRYYLMATLDEIKIMNSKDRSVNTVTQIESERVGSIREIQQVKVGSQIIIGVMCAKELD